MGGCCDGGACVVIEGRVVFSWVGRCGEGGEVGGVGVEGRLSYGMGCGR